MPSDHSALITVDNHALWDLERSWRTCEFTAEDGIGSMESLHQAGDSLVAVARFTEQGLEPIGSGVMVGPGVLLTATHVLAELAETGSPPLFITFLPDGARAWLGRETVTSSGESDFDESRKKVSDISLVSCTLNSDAYAKHPLGLAPLQVALPLVGDRLWAFGFRHHDHEEDASRLTPLVSSGLVTAAFPDGRGERMPAPCIEVAMDAFGGMSGGPVVNADGYVIGIVSSSLEDGPSYVTLIWDVLRHSVQSAAPQLRRGKVSLLALRDMGWVKLKGKVKRFRRGDVRLTLNDAEIQLMLDSGNSPRMDSGGAVFDNEQLESFMDEHQSSMESFAGDGAISYLQQAPLTAVRSALECNDIPNACLEPITAFSVLDFEGVEDLEVLSHSRVGSTSVAFSCAFDLLTVIWKVHVPTQVYRANEASFDEHFINVEAGADEMTEMETLQRLYFEAQLTFDQTAGVFTGIEITRVAVHRPRHLRPS